MSRARKSEVVRYRTEAGVKQKDGVTAAAETVCVLWEWTLA